MMTMNDVWPEHCIQPATVLPKQVTNTANATELTASDVRQVPYTSIGSFHRSWFAKRKKPVSMP